MAELLAGQHVVTHLPGPNGRPGGYPVVVSANGTEVRLPDGVTEQRAHDLNQRWAMLGGAVVDDGRVTYHPSVREAIKPVVPEVARSTGPKPWQRPISRAWEPLAIR